MIIPLIIGKQRDFWSFAAYFAQLSVNGMRNNLELAVADLDAGMSNCQVQKKSFRQDRWSRPGKAV